MKQTVIPFPLALFLLCGLSISVGGRAAASVDECPAITASAPNPYRGVFFDNDFSFLSDPCLARSDSRGRWARLTDGWKRRRIGNTILFDIGGEYRLRYHNEDGNARTRLAGLDNSFVLSRLRAYLNVEARGALRLYVEGLDAASVGEDQPSRGIEVNRWDFLNLFAEARARIPNGGRLAVRIGRQELQFGAERLISPLDWGNTRRSFDGVRANYNARNIALSAFYVNPREVRRGRLDGTRGSQTFAGLYSTYRGWKGTVFDFYGLSFEETAPLVTAFHLYTIGGRLKGGHGNLLWEGEAARQLGDFGALNQRASMLSLSVGYKLAGLLPGRAVVRAFYDLASGDGKAGDKKRGTFNQLFPLAHAYLGFIDLVGRQNIKALALRTVFHPAPRLTLNITGFSFGLARRNDGLYNAGGGRIRFDPTGAAGKDVGRELDVVAKIGVTPRIGLLFGYSRFWGGDFIDATNPPGVTGNARFFYTQLTTRY